MPEWWTYSLADFLMFSPGVYYRLFELENRRLWPYQIVALLAGIAAIALLVRSTARSRRTAIAAFAGAWGVCGWVYFHESYATIHTYANAFAWLFFAQAAALLLQVALGTERRTHPASPAVERAGIALAAFAILVLPLLTYALGRPFAQAESFALMPDPTALATVGMLIALRNASAWLFPIPLVWSLYSGLTLYTMGCAGATVPLLTAGIASVSCVLRSLAKNAKGFS